MNILNNLKCLITPGASAFIIFHMFEDIQKKYKKLDGVAPLITDPSPTSFTTLSEKNQKRRQKSDM